MTNRGDFRVAVIGINWGGPGPRDFESCLPRKITGIAVADLERPVSRRTLDFPPIHRSMVTLRSLRWKSINAAIVLSPHRLTREAYKRLAHHGRIATWLQDEPVGPRTLSFDPREFGPMFAASPNWVPDAQWLPWPHLVPSSGAVTKSRRTAAGCYAIIGSPYESRIELAERVREQGYQLVVRGLGWPSEFEALRPLGRLETLRWLSLAGHVVLNDPHPQMRLTYNPFFFDLAAAGIPQILTYWPPPFQQLHTMISFVTREQALPSPKVAASEIDTGSLSRAVLTRHDLTARLNSMGMLT